MAHARDYRTHIPRMGRAPELETDDPAFVVIFRGSVTLPEVGAPPPAGSGDAPVSQGSGVAAVAETGVICVVTDGQPDFYTNVDWTGYTT